MQLVGTNDVDGMKAMTARMKMLPNAKIRGTGIFCRNRTEHFSRVETSHKQRHHIHIAYQSHIGTKY
jgi:hypothetical protein